MEVREKDVPPPPERYKAYQSVLLRTSKVDLIAGPRFGLQSYG